MAVSETSDLIGGTDLAAAREFYHGKLGLQIDRESAIVFRCGNGTHLDVTESTVGTADQQTQAAWQVSDIRAEAGELHALGILQIKEKRSDEQRLPDVHAEHPALWQAGQQSRWPTNRAGGYARDWRRGTVGVAGPVMSRLGPPPRRT